jgi:hypothetical protein
VAERNVEIMVQEVKQRSPLLQTMQIVTKKQMEGK